MPATWTIPLINVIPGQTITASLWINEFENIDSNFTPAGMDDYSATDNEMRTATDPFPSGATSRPTSLQGEIERIRFQLNNITGETYWYEDPDVNISTFKTRFDAHTHDGTTNNGPQIGTTGIADNAITQAKMADNSIGTAEIFDDAITQAKMANNSVGTAEILDANVTLAKLAADSVDASKIAAGAVGNSELAAGAVTDAKVTDVAASKITGQIGTTQIADDAVTAAKIAADAVGSSEIAAGAVGSSELATDAVQTSKIGDGQVTYAKLASDVTSKLSPKSIQRFSTSVSLSLGTASATRIEGSSNQTITSIDTSKSYVNFEGVEIDAPSSAGGQFTGLVGKAQITSATNVEVIATCVTNGNNASATLTIKVWFTVVEWN